MSNDSPTSTERANDNEGPFSIGQNEWPGIAKLIEECGEVIQVCGKLIATGGRTDHWSGRDLAADLIEELGDLQAAISFAVAYNERLKVGEIMLRANRKLVLFEEWHGKSRVDQFRAAASGETP